MVMIRISEFPESSILNFIGTMFFFVGGIQPKTIHLDEQPGICPACGLPQARLKRVDHYLSAFFIPIFRVKKGEPFLQCANCGAVANTSGEVSQGIRSDSSRRCPHCGMPRKRDFRFCPYCGKPV
ncbi:MAG: hypothetical protein DRH37_04725 [Deltaproteobacteria bacterium]|nr:MAG: hypothetical protein DRH37_04725 [Deltaproteobacteria bacterium]